MTHVSTLRQVVPTLRPGPRTMDLQRLLRELERQTDGVKQATRSPVPLGFEAIDAHLPGGGLTRPGLHHVAGPLEAHLLPDGGAVGFAARIAAQLWASESPPIKPVLWIEETSNLYAPGLAQLGLDLTRLYIVQNLHLADRLWAMEEALRSGAVAGVITHANQLDLTAGRRLLLAAKEGGALGIILSSAPKASISTGLMSRWRVQMSGITRWRVDLERYRGSQPAAWELTRAQTDMTSWTCTPLKLAE